MWLHSLKVAQLLRSAACLHTNQSRSYLNHLVYQPSSRGSCGRPTGPKCPVVFFGPKSNAVSAHTIHAVPKLSYQDVLILLTSKHKVYPKCPASLSNSPHSVSLLVSFPRTVHCLQPNFTGRTNGHTLEVSKQHILCLSGTTKCSACRCLPVILFSLHFSLCSSILFFGPCIFNNEDKK